MKRSPRRGSPPRSTPTGGADSAQLAASLTEGERDRLVELFGVLGDTTRIRIAWALSEKELCVGDLAAALEMNQPAISRALKEMRLLRIVTSRHERQFVYYRLNEGHIRSLLAEAYEHAKSLGRTGEKGAP